MIGVYAIWNKITNDIYIGSSINILYRIKIHKKQLKQNRHHSILLQRAWNKYGKDNFLFIVLQLIRSRDIIEREQYWVNYYNPEYNINDEVDAVMSGRHHNKITCNRMSKLKLKNPTKYWLGKHIPNIIKNKISKTLKGKIGPNASRVFSKKWRINIARVNIGKKHSKETKRKMCGRVPWNKGKIGYKHTKEAILKISNASKKMWLTRKI